VALLDINNLIYDVKYSLMSKVHGFDRMSNYSALKRIDDVCRLLPEDKVKKLLASADRSIDLKINKIDFRSEPHGNRYENFSLLAGFEEP
jgi:hypothetical protein